MQLKTVLCEVYNYVLNEIFFQKQCIFKAFVQNPCFMRVHLCTKGDFLLPIFLPIQQLEPLGNWDLKINGTFE